MKMHLLAGAATLALCYMSADVPDASAGGGTAAPPPEGAPQTPPEGTAAPQANADTPGIDPAASQDPQTQDPSQEPPQAQDEGDQPQPKDEPQADEDLRMDGPTLEEFVAAGYDPAQYPPRGYAVVTKETQLTVSALAARLTKLEREVATLRHFR